MWGYHFRDEDDVQAPSAAAELWRSLASWFPEELAAWLESGGYLPPPRRPSGIGALLQDMRWVLRHNEEADNTPSRRNCRLVLKKSVSGFFKQLFRLELAARR
jgi:hypothetical protein